MPAFCLWQFEATADDETLLTVRPAESRPHSHSALTKSADSCLMGRELTVRNSEE